MGLIEKRIDEFLSLDLNISNNFLKFFDNNNVIDAKKYIFLKIYFKFNH